MDISNFHTMTDQNNLTGVSTLDSGFNFVTFFPSL